MMDFNTEWRWKCSEDRSIVVLDKGHNIEVYERNELNEYKK